MGKLCIHVDVENSGIVVENEVKKFRERLASYMDDTEFISTSEPEELDEAQCSCATRVPGVLFPMEVGGTTIYKSSSDGRVLVQRCDECSLFASDEEAAKFLAIASGKPLRKWFDDAHSPHWHWFIDMSIKEAEEFRLRPVCNDACSYAEGLRYLYKAAMELGANHPQTYLHYIQEAHNRFGKPWFCKAEGCRNQGRYSSGYCGVCDIEFNNGKGERQ